MKSPLNRTTLIFGSVILALMVIDGLIQLRSASPFSPVVQSNSMAAVFLIGLTVGTLAGIGIFFTHLMLQQKASAKEARELDLFLEEIALTEEEDDFSFLEDSMVDEKAELNDPWERPADWWMNSDED